MTAGGTVLSLSFYLCGYLSKECGQILSRLFPLLIHHHPFITVLSLVNVFFFTIPI